MKIRYFIEKEKEHDQGMIWRVIGKKVEFMNTSTNNEYRRWTLSALKSKEIEAPEMSLKEIMPQELALFF